jgi:diadenosine tetraphosphate (Ap4A) HIT family hydrolase
VTALRADGGTLPVATSSIRPANYAKPRQDPVERPQPECSDGVLPRDRPAPVDPGFPERFCAAHRIRGDTAAMSDCPFCSRIVSGSGVLRSNEVAVAFADAFPVSDGHALIVPSRHVVRLELLEPDEWLGLLRVVQQIRLDIAAQAGVVGVNVGFNSGAAAGQTVEHAHVHAIPRRLG